jgi:cation diffusion facilitator family transporter
MQIEKTRVAMVSVVAAIFLTATKLIVGLTTDSLGILSEAAHSALDLGAALLTYIAVRISDKPPDEEHSYGHGKIENVAAFMQTGILIVTCFFIIKAAIDRLYNPSATVQVNVWSYTVLIVSVAVDFTRSRALTRVARKYRSQALEADALHFSTDIWSSMVVIIGLIGTSWGFPQGDSLAAIGVAAFVLFISSRLLKRTIDSLTDVAPRDIALKAESVLAAHEGVHSHGHLRVRQSGSKVFIDTAVRIKRTYPFDKAHHVADEIEDRIARLVPNADIVIHMEPEETEDESIIDKIRMIVIQEGLACHNVRAQKIRNGYVVDFHLECDPYPTFAEAHAVSSRIEARLMEKIPEILDVKTHIEDARDRVLEAVDITDRSEELIVAVRAAAQLEAGVQGCTDFVVLKIGDTKKVLMNCVIAPHLSLDEVHTITTSLENRIYESVPEVRSVVIHPEIPL